MIKASDCNGCNIICNDRDRLLAELPTIDTVTVDSLAAAQYYTEMLLKLKAVQELIHDAIKTYMQSCDLSCVKVDEKHGCFLETVERWKLPLSVFFQNCLDSTDDPKRLIAEMSESVPPHVPLTTTTAKSLCKLLGVPLTALTPTVTTSTRLTVR